MQLGVGHLKGFPPGSGGRGSVAALGEIGPLMRLTGLAFPLDVGVCGGESSGVRVSSAG